MADQTILVADDSEIIREVLSSFLGTSGYRVDTAADGQSALDLFRTTQHDLIITDLQMPRLAGLPLLKMVKAIDSDVQVIILTGHATLETAIEALRLGAYDYLFKPVEDMEMFGRLVKRALEHRAVLYDNKRLVSELQQANARLEDEVAARTHELQVANESLRSLDSLKNDFISVVSHELRTPLSVILLEAQLLEQSTAKKNIPADKLKSIYATLMVNARRLLIQIENLLDFSLIERGELVLSLKPCSIHQVVREVVDLYEVRAAEKHILLKSDLAAATSLSVIADGPRLRSALVHVVDNAVKFTPAGGTVTIKVHSNVTMPGTDEPAVAIVVRDTGIGIPAERQQILFTSFSQVDMTATRRYGGMGIGLALAARILAAHRGRITLQSEPGKGSIFALWVPMRV